MRINKVYIKNLNSLKGEHTINFDNEYWKQSSLFLISGPTGAGKSTILDAISLALFNEIPRLGSISKRTVDENGAIMTHNCDEAISEIEYTVNDIRYRSRWSIRKARTGSLSDYTMELTNLTKDEILPLRKSDVPLQNQKIIKLNSQQFLKSILLSQGEFAQFLKAKPEERSELLEKLTGTTIYRELGILAYNRYKEVSKLYDDKKVELGAIILFSDKEILDFNATLSFNKEVLSTLNEQYRLLSAELEKSKSFLILSKSLEEKDQLLKNYKTKYESIIPQISRLELHDKLNPFREAILLNDELERAIKKDQIELNLELCNLKEAESTINGVIEEYSHLVSEKVPISSFMTHMKAFEASFTSSKTILNEKKLLGQQQNQLFESKIAKIKDAKLRMLLLDKKTTNKLKIIKENEKLLQERIKNQIHFNFVIDALNFQSENNLIIREKSNLEQQLHNLRGVEKQIIHHEKIRNEITNLNQEFSKLIREIEQDRNEINIQEKDLSAINYQYEKLKKQEPLVEVTKDLNIGDACPICGNPIQELFVHDLAKIGSIAIKKSVIEEKLRNITVEFQNKINKKSSLEALLADKNNQFNESAESIPDNFAIGTNQLDNLISITTEHIKEYNQRMIELNECFLLSEQLRILADLKVDTIYLEELRREYAELYVIHKEKYKELNIPEITNHLQNRLTEARQLSHISRGAIERINLSISENNKKLNSISEQLTKDLKALNFDSIADAKNSLLTDDEYSATESARDQLINNINSISTEISLLRSQIFKIKEDNISLDIASLEAQLSNLNLEIENINREIGSINEKLSKNNIEKNKRNILEAELQNLDKNCKKWRLLSHIIGDSEGKKFAHFAQTLSLKNLLSYANARLNTLTDRYLLVMPETIKSDLEIIDTYQGNVRRTVKTLSGGETFIVSLALALSLSDLASKNNPIDCLFIDEGFGTLDPETLEVAMNTLDTLQYQTQKQIGIISHVASLKERISTQIVLVRDGLGYSKLEFK